MEEIDNLIRSYKLPPTLSSVESNFLQDQNREQIVSLATPIPTLPHPKITQLKRAIIISKIIISELIDKINQKESEKGFLEVQLNEALNTIKNLHQDYCNLTDRFSKVKHSSNNTNNNCTNQSMQSNNSSTGCQTCAKLEENLKEIESEKNEIMTNLVTKEKELKDKEQELTDLNKQINELKEEKKNKSDLYQINIKKLNEKITMMQDNLDTVEKQLEDSNKLNKEVDVPNIIKEKDNLVQTNYDIKKENINLKKEMETLIKTNNLEIQNLKNSITLLESKNHTLSVEIKEKDIELQKQLKLNEQYNILDQQFSFSIKEKDKNYNILNEQYNNLFNEFKLFKNNKKSMLSDYEDKIDKLTEDKCSLGQKYKELKNKYNELQKKYDEMEINLNSLSSSSSGFKSNNNRNNHPEKDSTAIEEELKEQIFILTEQKKYIEQLLIKTHPNGKLIKQIVELNADVIQLELQKKKLEKKMDFSKKSKEVMAKIVKQIDIFKANLKKLEIELSMDLHAESSKFMSSLSEDLSQGF